MDNNIMFVLVAGLLALAFSYWKTSWIENLDQGTERMKVIGASIADGAMAFLRAEYRVLTVIVVAVAILLGFAKYLISTGTGLAQPNPTRNNINVPIGSK